MESAQFWVSLRPRRNEPRTIQPSLSDLRSRGHFYLQKIYGRSLPGDDDCCQNKPLGGAGGWIERVLDRQEQLGNIVGDQWIFQAEERQSGHWEQVLLGGKYILICNLMIDRPHALFIDSYLSLTNSAINWDYCYQLRLLLSIETIAINWE